MSSKEYIGTYDGSYDPFDYLPGDGEILPVLQAALDGGDYLSDVIEVVREVSLPSDKNERKRAIASIRQEGLMAQWHAEDLRRQGDPAATDVGELANMVSEVASMYGTARPGVRREHDEVELEISRNLRQSNIATEAHWTAFARDSQVVHGKIHKAFGVPVIVETLPVSSLARRSPEEKSLPILNNKQRAVATVLATAFLSGVMPTMAQAAPEVKSTARPVTEAPNPHNPNDPANLVALSTPLDTSRNGSGDKPPVISTVLQETNNALSGLLPAPIAVIAAPNKAQVSGDLGTPEVAPTPLGDKDGIGLVPAPINAISKSLDAAPGSGGTPEIAVPVAPPLPPVEAEPAPEPTPKAPDTPAPVPAPSEKMAPLPDIIIDPALAGETQWSATELKFIRDNIDMYTNIEKETGVEWEIMVALHYRETSLGMTNPANGQGLFQLYSSGEHFNPGPVTKEEFTRQGILAANLLKEKTKIGAVYGELLLSDPNKVKDVLFSYNGRASQYIKQSKDLGFSLPAEGSPYVMNLADDKRNSAKNPNWGQILTDNGPLGRANQKPGAWVQIEGLVKINKIAHDRAATDTQKRVDAAPTTPDSKVADEKPQFTNWTYPVPKGTPTTSGFGPRGEGGKHDGEDFGANTGTPFYAAAGGVAKVIVMDVREGGWCQKALAPLGMNVSQVADPIQKEVRITSIINGHTYETIYAHLSKVEVAPNQVVTAGTEIGKTGGSGCSTGPHAHFEVRRDGVPIDPGIILDPVKWQALQDGNIKVASIDSQPAVSKQLVDNTQAVATESVSVAPNTQADTTVDAGNSAAQQAVDRAKRAVSAAKAATEHAQREKVLVK